MLSMFKLLKQRIHRSSVQVLGCERKLSQLLPKTEKESESVTDERQISCNKSGLLNHHRNVLHNKVPYKEPNSWIHLTEKYQRKVFGRYGSDSGVSPRICFGTKCENSFKYNYEQLAEPEMLQSMVNKYKFDQKHRSDQILKREEEISKKIEKLNQWKHDLNARKSKKEADAIAAKEKKDRLIEEVRRYFGYKIDPRDERFKEMLDQKEREDKKKNREEKRKAKEEKILSKLTQNI